MKPFSFTLALAALLLLALPLSAQRAFARETIVVGDVSWDASHAISNVLKVIIEDKLGADVKIVPAEEDVVFAGVDKGDGSFDVHPDFWIPIHDADWAKSIVSGSRETVLVNDQPYLGSEGIYIPGFIQDNYGVKSVKQLADPKIAKLFDWDGSGKGSYWPGASDWPVFNVEKVRAKSFGYDKTLKLLVATDAEIRTKLAEAFAKKKAFVLYYWEPEGLFKKYDLRKLKQPAFDGYATETKQSDPQYKADGCYKMYQPQERSDWLEQSKVTCSNPHSTVYVAFSKSLRKRAPKVAQFLKQVNFEASTLNEWIFKVSEKEDPYQLAKKWVGANPTTVNSWLRGIK